MEDDNKTKEQLLAELAVARQRIAELENRLPADCVKIVDNNVGPTLSESEECFRQLAENISEVCRISDLINQKIVYINPAYQRIWQRSCASLYQDPKSFIDTIVPEDREQVIRAMEKHIKGELTETEYRIVQPDGNIRSIRDRGFPIKDENGQVYRVAEIAEDITELKNYQENLTITQERAHLAMESANIGTWDYDPTTNSLIWSDLCKAIFGVSAETEVDYEFFLAGLHPDDRARVDQDVWRALDPANSGRYKVEYRTIRPLDGAERWISAQGKAFFNKLQPIRFVGSLMDITEQKHLELQLREQTETVETINQVGRVLSGELDLSKLLQAITDAATELTGAQFGAFFYTVTNNQGESFVLYTLSGVPIEHFSHFPVPRNTELFGPTFRGEGKIRCDDVRQDPRYGKNSPYYGIPPNHLPVISYLAVPVVSRSSEVIGGLFFGHSRTGVFTERHERILDGLAAQLAIAIDNARLYKQSQEAVSIEQQLRQESERANKIKDDFLSTVSHELRTPLTSILGWAHLLKYEKLDIDTMKLAIDTIDRNAKLQANIVDDLLDIARIISGKLSLDVNWVELDYSIAAAIETVRTAADAKAIKIQTLIETGVDRIFGDASRLQQVVWNLLSNAIKFTPKGGLVQVRLEKIDSHIEIAVIDNGTGINPEFLPYVFERFRQADSSITRAHGGLGLGLALVRQLVEMHGGTVHAESKGHDQGSTFTVKLPLMGLRMDVVDELRSFFFNRESLDNYAQLNGLNILIVEDDTDTLILLTMVLEKCQAKVYTATNFDEALEVIYRVSPDFLISDIGLPTRNGYDLIKEIRQIELKLGKRIPAIALTAYARREDREKSLNSGFQAHLSKPVEPKKLLETVVEVINKKVV